MSLVTLLAYSFSSPTLHIVWKFILQICGDSKFKLLTVYTPDQAGSSFLYTCCLLTVAKFEGIKYDNKIQSLAKGQKFSNVLIGLVPLKWRGVDGKEKMKKMKELLFSF